MSENNIIIFVLHIYEGKKISKQYESLTEYYNTD